MIYSLPTRTQEIILANMKQEVSLTLGILMSLYPRANMGVMGEGFAVMCNDEEALKLIVDSAVMAGYIVDILPVDMSLG
jgi:hypothetical protein